MGTLEIGRQFVKLCQGGEFDRARAEHYAEDVVALAAPSEADATQTRIEGLAAVLHASTASDERVRHEYAVGPATVTGPFADGRGDAFAMLVEWERKRHATSTLTRHAEIWLLNVRADKICREQRLRLESETV